MREIIEKWILDNQAKRIEPDTRLKDMVPLVGYQEVSPDEYYIQDTVGIGVFVQPTHHTYNNGVYILYQIPDGVDVRYELLVVVPNTKSKAPLVRNVLHTLEKTFTEIDSPDLSVYNHMEIMMYFIQNTIIVPLAKGIYPNDEVKQSQFVQAYFPKFLMHIGMFHLGETEVYEEQIVAEPYVIKSILDKSVTDNE